MTTEQHYGASPPADIADALLNHAEELTSLGVTVIEGALPESQLEVWRNRIDRVYSSQEAEFGGREQLREIGEIDICRAPLLYDPAFITMASVTDRRIGAN